MTFCNVALCTLPGKRSVMLGQLDRNLFNLKEATQLRIS